MSNTEHKASLLEALENIETELKALECWGGVEKRPADDAFLSETPFFLDTMDFHQWLEYVFIPKFHEMIETNAPLPEQMMIHTVAQVTYKGQWGRYQKLIQHLMHIDKLINEAKHQLTQSFVDKSLDAKKAPRGALVVYA